METIHTAREIGFRICCGGIIGMGETMEERIEMACFLQKEGVLSIPLNLLQPITGNSYGEYTDPRRRGMANNDRLFRLINPNAFLRFSGGRAQLSEATQRKSLYIGINSAIIGDLLTTIGSKVEEDKVLFTSEAIHSPKTPIGKNDNNRTFTIRPGSSMASLHPRPSIHFPSIRYPKRRA